MSAIITVEDVERFRATDLCAAQLVRDRQVIRDDAATAVEHEFVYAVAGERVLLRQIPGGYIATHDCPSCAADRPCFRALAAVDAKGTERFVAECNAVWHAAKLEAAR